MTKIGILVGENGNWSFFRDIYQYISEIYQTSVFRKRTYNTPLLYGRLNRWIYNNDIRKMLQKNHLCFFEWASELLVIASHMPKSCPIITRLHSYELYAWAPKINWDNVDRIILVSHAIREKFNHLYPEHSHKTMVIHNAKPLNKFTYSERDFSFSLGMLCSLNPRKRVYEVILMLWELKSLGYQPHLHIGGERLSGPDFDEYYVATQNLVGKLNLEDSVSFHGRINDVPKWLKNIDIFISNSYWEGLQVALIEAMATGCYCLSHFWDGAEEALPEDNIFASENELKEKIISYSLLPETDKKRMQENMCAIAKQKFDISEILPVYKSLIDEIANNFE